MKPTGLCGLVTRIARTLKPWTVVADRKACLMMSQKTTALRNRLGTDLRALLVAQHLIPLTHHPHTSPSHITLTHHPHTSPSYITLTHHLHTSCTSPSHITLIHHLHTSYLTVTYHAHTSHHILHTSPSHAPQS